MSARTLAIGDIHGCHVALDLLLSKLEITADDTVVLLGDVVSRGPGTKECVERLLQLKENCRLIFIRGNHEEMMLDSLVHGRLEQIWLAHGGLEALKSYGGGYDCIPETHIEFLNSAIDYWQNDSEIFIHANLEPDVPLEEQTAEWLRWIRFSGVDAPHPSGKRVLCGHTPQPSGLPHVIDGWICLDTWAYEGKYLSCLDLATDTLYQSNQSGEFRSGELGELEAIPE